jgi:hypothetical protein
MFPVFCRDAARLTELEESFMKSSAIEVLFIPYINAVRFSMPTSDFEKWLREERALVKAMSDSVVYGESVTTITMPASLFEICKKYCRFS